MNLVEPTPREIESPEDPLPPHWSRNPWGRTILGVVVAQGLYYVLRSLVLAGALAVTDGSNAARVEFAGVISTQVLQIFALLAGSLLAGAGQRNGGLFGSLVGVWNGILCTMIQGLQGEPVTAVNLYGQPILHTAFGAFGGMLGSWLWSPIGTSRGPLLKVSVRVPSTGALFHLTHAQIHWFRIFAGIAIAIGGYVWADTILRLVLETSEGRLSIRSSMQQWVLTLEIAALAVFIGGAFAGATTWSGTTQGAWVGILCSVIYAGYQFGYIHQPNLGTLGLLTGGVLALSVLGGSFGSRLMPPLPRHPRKVASAAI